HCRAPTGGHPTSRSRTAPGMGRARGGDAGARVEEATVVNVIRTVADMRDAADVSRAANKRIGLVPTMGALHDGHLSLMRQARERCDWTVVSLFVNPTQFNEATDLERYPRDEARDAELVKSMGIDVLFAPTVAEVYPRGSVTSVDVAGLSEVLEGAIRGASHFRGVATV